MVSTDSSVAVAALVHAVGCGRRLPQLVARRASADLDAQRPSCPHAPRSLSHIAITPCVPLATYLPTYLTVLLCHPLQVQALR